MNRIKLVVGDWYGDGHEKTEDFTILSNLSKKEIESAYKKASAKLGFSFIDKACSSYQENDLSVEILKTLIEYGLKLSDLYLDKFELTEAKHVFKTPDKHTLYLVPKSYLYIYLFIIKLGNDSFKYEIEKYDSINIGGYGLFLD